MCANSIAGLEIPFANRDRLIRLKQGKREKDRIDLEYPLRSWPEAVFGVSLENQSILV
jgi:hypothetical protein